jgi:hypothetical protein
MLLMFQVKFSWKFNPISQGLFSPHLLWLPDVLDREQVAHHFSLSPSFHRPCLERAWVFGNLVA